METLRSILWNIRNHQPKPIHTVSHPIHLNHHNSAVRTSSFMYVNMFLISLWHFIIYDPVVGNTAQLGMLLPSGRWVMCWFILLCWLAFGGGSYCPQAICPPSTAWRRCRHDDAGPGAISCLQVLDGMPFVANNVSFKQGKTVCECL